MNVLSILAINTEAERVFSGVRQTISWERMQLGADTIEMLECLKHCNRSKRDGVDINSLSLGP